MQSPMLSCLAVLAVVVVLPQLYLAQQSLTIKTELLELTVMSVKTADSFPAYVGAVGEGPALVSPIGGGMPNIYMAQADDGKTYTYLAGEVRAQPSNLLVELRWSVTNSSPTVQHLTIGDIGIACSRSVGLLTAFGVGDFPFFKTGSARDTMKKSPVEIKPQGKRNLTYVYAVPKDSKSCRGTYRGKQTTELEGTER